MYWGLQVRSGRSPLSWSVIHKVPQVRHVQLWSTRLPITHTTLLIFHGECLFYTKSHLRVFFDFSPLLGLVSSDTPKKLKGDRQRLRWNQVTVMTLLTPGLGASPAEDATPVWQSPSWTLTGPVFCLLRTQEWDSAMSGIYEGLYQRRKLLCPFCPPNKNCRKWSVSCPVGDTGRWAGAPMRMAPEIQFEQCFCCYLLPAVATSLWTSGIFMWFFPVPERLSTSSPNMCVPGVWVNQAASSHDHLQQFLYSYCDFWGVVHQPHC